jgi:uncharacterized membrane protein
MSATSVGERVADDASGSFDAEARSGATAKRPAMMTPERLQSLSGGVFAVVITVLVLDLRAPDSATWSALGTIWPTAASYAVSYVFVAIAWINGHHLLRHAQTVTATLLWANFAHLFTVSLVPFTAEWMSKSRLGSAPVALYAAVFVLVNISYIVLCREAVDTADEAVVSKKAKEMMRMRSTVTLLAFGAAGVLALWHPVWGFVLVTACLMTYLRPGAGMR